MNGWKTIIGSILTAAASALIAIDTDPTRLMIWKVLAAIGGALLGIGISGKMDKLTAAMAKPVEIIAATPEAKAILRESPTVLPEHVP
jgi:hypothetical protein